MILAKDAYHNMILHQKREPIRSISTISEMVKVASLLGFESVEIFLRVKDEVKIKNKLKSCGYVIDSIYSQALPDEVLVKIKWNTSQFIGDTMKEINDDR